MSDEVCILPNAPFFSPWLFSVSQAVWCCIAVVLVVAGASVGVQVVIFTCQRLPCYHCEIYQQTVMFVHASKLISILGVVSSLHFCYSWAMRRAWGCLTGFEILTHRWFRFLPPSERRLIETMSLGSTLLVFHSSCTLPQRQHARLAQAVLIASTYHADNWLKHLTFAAGDFGSF